MSRINRSRGMENAHVVQPVAHRARQMTGAASKTPPANRRGKTARKPLKGRHRESARKALLTAGDDHLEVDYSSGDVVLQGRLGGVPIFEGAWDAVVQTSTGSRMPARGGWECACWHADADGDYLELQLWLADDVRIDRILFLSRSSRFALLADAVAAQCGASPGGEISSGGAEYSAVLPLTVADWAADGQSTCELRLSHSKAALRAYGLELAPLGTTEGAGSLTFSGGSLRLVQPLSAGSVWAPLLLDWDPGRVRKRAVVRRLTVSEARRVLAPHEARGERWQCGDQHLVVYRALSTPDTARAVLGMHTWFETVVARLKRPGEFEPLVQIEPLT